MSPLTKAEAFKELALRRLRLAVLALHDDARECYLTEALEAMRESLLMEELGK